MDNSDTHTSGHGSQDDLMLMLSLTKPNSLFSSWRTSNVKKHKVAVNFGGKSSNILVLDNGDVAALTKNQLNAGRVTAGDVYIDGLGIGSTGSQLIKERKLLSEDGLLAIVLSVDKDRKTIKKPALISRGFIFMKKSEELITSIQEFTENLYQKFVNENIPNNNIKTESELQNFIYQASERKPVIIVTIIQV